MFSRELKRLTVNNKDTDIITISIRFFFLSRKVCAIIYFYETLICFSYDSYLFLRVSQVCKLNLFVENF